MMTTGSDISVHDHAGSHAYRVGVDVGGTFTDLVAINQGAERAVTIKVPSTPGAPEEAVLDALGRFIALAGSGRMPAIVQICHSTTIATNALLGQLNLEPPRVGLLTTEGFRDVLEIGRQGRAEVYNLRVERPRPLAERRDRIGVSERIGPTGAIIQALDRSAVRCALRDLRAHGVRDIAVVFLHSYANPIHERQAAAIAESDFPDLQVTLSSEVNPEYREYERSSTTVVTAALRPIVSSYLQRLERGVRSLRITAPILVMGSHGGMADLPTAAARPAALIESGPAGGLAAAAEMARCMTLERVLSFDMGGTTAKAGAVLGGVAETVAEFEAAGRTHSGRHIRGSGYPVRFPFLDLAEVSAGGGTIAHLDAGGALRVGPISAGADPGPACYGRGGKDPTVTDANVLLGRLSPTHLLGGAMPIDQDAARRAMAALARRLNMAPIELAAGIVRLANADMARALRIVSVERGHDPRRFAMIAFGGGGPLHACALAGALGLSRIVVPPEPGLFSAAGLLTSPLKVALVRPVLMSAAEVDSPHLTKIFAGLEQTAIDDLRRQGADPSKIMATHTLELRYFGQSFELAVPVMPSVESWMLEAIARFHQRHHDVYGYASPHHAVEIVTARVAATAPASSAQPPTSPRNPGDARKAPSPRSTRVVFFGQQSGFVETPIYWRDDLSAGVRLSGPAVVEQYDTTTLLPPGWRLQVDEAGNFLLEADTM